MADYVSIYTGAQLDKSIASGSSVTGKIKDNTLISGSLLSTGSFGYLNVVGDGVGTSVGVEAAALYAEGQACDHGLLNGGS